MPIEFRCPNCQKLLRVGDDAAGKQAKCPACGTLNVVPPTSSMQAPPPLPPPLSSAADSPFGSSSGSPFGPPSPGPMPSSAPPSDNPYAAPLSAGGVTMGLHIRPTIITINGVFEDAWSIFKTNAGMLILVHFVEIIIGIALNIVTTPLLFLAQNDQALMVAFSLFRGLALALVTIWLGCGRDLYFMRTAKGEPTTFSMLFSGHPVLLPRLLFFLLLGLGSAALMIPAIVIGIVVGQVSGNQDMGLGVGALVALLCFIPYVWVALTYGQAWFVYLEQPVGVFEGLRISSVLTRGNKPTLFGLGILAYLMGMIGFCGCYLGALVTLPLMYLTLLVAYLQMAGRPIVGPYMMPPSATTPFTPSYTPGNSA